LVIRRVWFVLLAIVVLLGVALVVALTHLRVRAATSRLPERGSMVEVVAGCPARVQILIDGRGIPHVESDSESALWFGLGYLHARDRFFQMELARRVGAGRLAEIFGEMALDSDRRMRTLRLAATARRQTAMLTVTERRVMEAYTAGINAALDRFGKWIAPEAWLLGVDPEPWQVEDSLTIGLLLQLDLSLRSICGVGPPPRRGPGFRLAKAYGTHAAIMSRSRLRWAASAPTVGRCRRSEALRADRFWQTIPTLGCKCPVHSSPSTSGARERTLPAPRSLVSRVL
jgi:hypothetical protein